MQWKTFRRALKVVGLLLITLSIFQCGNSKDGTDNQDNASDNGLDVVFNSAFPKLFSKNLARKWGEELRVLQKDDTVTVGISYNRKKSLNRLTFSNTLDTLWCEAHSYKNTYFLSAPKDSSYKLYMVLMTDTTVTGLLNYKAQNSSISKYAEQSLLQDLKVDSSGFTQNHRLVYTPDKKPLWKHYSAILASWPAHDLVNE